MITCLPRRASDEEALDLLLAHLPDEDPAHLRRLATYRSPLLSVLGLRRSPFDALRWAAYSTARWTMGVRP